MAGIAIIGFREALEASLVIGIMLGYLSKTGQPSHLRRWVWMGVWTAILASTVVAYLFKTFTGGFEGRGEQLFEGSIMLLTVALISYTVIWMQKQARGVAARVRAKTDRAIGTDAAQTGWGLAGLAFASVVREGVEAVLFLEAAWVAGGSAGDWLAFILGIAAAVALAVAASSSTARLDLRRFFKVSGLLLVLFGGGLLAHGIHEFQEAGVLPVVVEHVWDLGKYLSDERGLGQLLRALFGYSSAPSLLEVIAWITFVFFAGRSYLKTGSGNP